MLYSLVVITQNDLPSECSQILQLTNQNQVFQVVIHIQSLHHKYGCNAF